MFVDAVGPSVYLPRFLRTTPPVHDGALCPNSSSFVMLIRKSMNSTPKSGFSLISTMNWIFARV
jgi:hypothetical protein